MFEICARRLFQAGCRCSPIWHYNNIILQMYANSILFAWVKRCTWYCYYCLIRNDDCCTSRESWCSYYNNIFIIRELWSKRLFWLYIPVFVFIYWFFFFFFVVAYCLLIIFQEIMKTNTKVLLKRKRHFINEPKEIHFFGNGVVVIQNWYTRKHC